MKETLPADLPKGTEKIYRQHLASDPQTRAEMRENIDEYMEEVEDTEEAELFLDLNLARDLAHSLRELIDSADDDQLDHVRAAMLYFIDEEDVESDQDSPIGFDDDAEVFNAVCRHLGRADLQVSLEA